MKRRTNMIDGLLREKVSVCGCDDGQKECDTKFCQQWRQLKDEVGYIRRKMRSRNQLMRTNVDPENLTKQSDADLHHMQEQIFASERAEES